METTNGATEKRIIHTIMRSPAQVKEDIETYLGRIDAAIIVLIERPFTKSEPTIHSIASHLLQAFAPDNLGLSLPDCIRPPELDLMEDGDDDDEDEEINLINPPAVPTKRSRLDFLRHIFRAMPPIAMDVAATLCDLVDPQHNNIYNHHHSLTLFFLFSAWLPIAPQLTPLVHELFSAMQDAACPLNLSTVHLTTTTSGNIIQFLVAQAAHYVYEFFAKRGEPADWWSLAALHKLLIRNDDIDMEPPKQKNKWSFDYQQATRWHAARAIGYNRNWRPNEFKQFLANLSVSEDIPVWILHPWIIQDDDSSQQQDFINGTMRLFHQTFPLPTAWEVRRVIPLHKMLTHTGHGIVFFKHFPLSATMDTGVEELNLKRRLCLTTTTMRNMALLGAALAVDPYPRPILICGPPGSGKSCLVRELIQHFHSSQHNNELLELHFDEETDSKTLVGSYTTTDIPGEFTWRPGALTTAVRAGKWVLMEDVDTVPIEIQAALVKLLEDRMLYLGGGKYERCHSNFRLFGTCTLPFDSRRRDAEKVTSLRMSTYGTGGKKVLHPNLWTKIHVNPLPMAELNEIAQSLYPSIPPMIVDSALAVFEALDQSGRESARFSTEDVDGMPATPVVIKLESFRNGRHASVRDFLKLLSRIAQSVSFERNVTYATEIQRTLCLAETVDIFAACCPERDQRREFISQIAAPLWGITADFAQRYIETRQPVLTRGEVYTEVGRAKIPVPQTLTTVVPTDQKFAYTNYALRLMESIAVGIVQNEPMLLVGETGCGKTSLIQQLARSSDRELIVQNLSLQTDSTDLLGGYRPLETRQIARQVYMQFVDLFCSSFSRKQNADFLSYASSVHKKEQWQKLSQCFQRAASLGLQKVKKEGKATSKNERMTVKAWNEFAATAQRFEKQRQACDSGLAFSFTEGALVDAIRSGKWVLLDEMNLASSETLQRLCGLLDDSSGSVTLTERGDAEALARHPEFRLFAAMNPATDAGKKDLPSSIRSRFTEIYVDEMLDPMELRVVASKYLNGVITAKEKPLEHTDTVINLVDVYLKCRDLADKTLVDASGHRPRYTLRTLCRALSAAKNLITKQKVGISRAIFEGFELAFEGPLDPKSLSTIRQLFKASLGQTIPSTEIDHPGRRPGNVGEYVLLKPFWIKAGSLDPEDWSESSSSGRPKFILTKSMSSNLRRLVRACASGPWPILLEGPTSAGKTTLVEYLAARCGHHVVRINNHEHTDVQEYTGAYAADSNGSLSFRDGILVQALRQGHWVILDELNLAPSEVLEALNRLLDDNRELFLPEINEVVKPHPNFRLFATQNPSGAYGGRKPLSRAFRNRFVEIHMGEIPLNEMITILELRSNCPPSHAKALVDIMATLRTRRSKSGVFLGKDGLITPRDLLRWGERHAGSKIELAQEGYMLLGERLRSEEERDTVKEVIEAQLKVSIDCDSLYHGKCSMARSVLSQHYGVMTSCSIAATHSMLRLLSLVLRCIKQREPVLLVGDTGCGKTTVVQLLGAILNRKLHIINCHATTETSDLIGGLRPVRSRGSIPHEMLTIFKEILDNYPDKDDFSVTIIPDFALRDSEVTLPENATKTLIEISRKLREKLQEARVDTSRKVVKRRKLDSGSQQSSSERDDLINLFNEMEVLHRRLAAPFEWCDGPLVTAMRRGNLVLLDEMSLADDAVLERLNSVLEPTRTIVLAEKGDDGLRSAETSHIVKGHDDFLIFATMNPGGDFGKKELSSALRSRFTEIWVPAIKDLKDIDLVLSSILQANGSEHNVMELRNCILDYISWFNSSLCGDPSSPFIDLVLSLRDVITWARFVVEASEKMRSLNIWEAYCHGACLMHLDGLGLGTGLSTIDADMARSRAFAFLLSQVPPSSFTSCEATLQQEFHHSVLSEHEFGIHPFTIPLGPKVRPESGFNFSAPTTAKNLLRVIRAMQISKPVLLEGSPGVGKTSLISALAIASGYELVRINLSEQTDISDLMGSDLPVPEDSEGGGDGNSASFTWCDGALLRAIKRGDWVLLDELNLASQSVLEGLNSCLDHRAEVYIPELGQTFHCPSSFRIFAAQNPVAQGGGRKGLPKSFLNRFSKVYVDSLKQSDLNAIVASQFPSIPAELACTMVNFNSSLHEFVVERGEFGDAGKPWEFNLRDVFRWCELVQSADDSMNVLDCVGSFARDIYLQRFRSTTDRVALQMCFKQHFGTETVANMVHGIAIGVDGLCRIGNTTLQNCTSEEVQPGAAISIIDDPLVRSLLTPMEALARCINMKWPCLLVGPSSSGKTTLLQAMATLADANLVNVCLTPSSDVNELVGGFEQIDTMKDVVTLLARIKCFYDTACKCSLGTNGECEIISDVADLLAKLECVSFGKDTTNANKNTMVKLASQLLVSLSSFAEINKSFCQFFARHSTSMSNVIVRIQAGTSETGHFSWVDGVLVDAMTHGYWLHLENVNLCPSSVLDRLNPIMENNGELLLNECSTSDEDSGQRIVSAHTNFRVFLSMNSEFGEVSRAMRNRCVEIALLEPNALNDEDVVDCTTLLTRSAIDLLDILSTSGVPTIDVGSSVNMAHKQELCHSAETGVAPVIKKPVEVARGFRSLQNRGFAAEQIDKFSHQIYYEYPDEQEPHPWSSCTIPSLSLHAPTLRWGWCFQPSIASHSWRGRLVRSSALCFQLDFHEDKSFLPHWLSLDLQGDLATFVGTSTQLSRMNSTFFVMALYCENEIQGFRTHDGFTSSYHSGIANGLELLGSIKTKSPEFSTDHLSQLAVEAVKYQMLKMMESAEIRSPTLSPLETSFCLFEGSLDRSSIICPVTPTIYPLFRALDEYVLELLVRKAQWFSIRVVEAAVELLLARRDQIWTFLCHADRKQDRTTSFWGFEEAGFIVQWVWFKKQYTNVTTLLQSLHCGRSKQTLDILMETIDHLVFDSSGDLQPITDSVWKCGGHPVIPATPLQWEVILRLRLAGASRSLIEDIRFNGTMLGINQEQIELGELINTHHPILFTTRETSADFLGALCMMFFSSTDEAQDFPKILNVKVEDYVLLEKKLALQGTEFSATWDSTIIDFDIETVENSIGVEKLEGLRQHITSNSSSEVSVNDSVLNCFAEIQASPFVEFWCVQEESTIVSHLASAATSHNVEIFDRLIPRIQNFIEVCLNCCMWPVGDLRPFQSLVWVLNASSSRSAPLDRFIKCVLPVMIKNSSKHMWCNSFNRLHLLTDKIELPVRWTTSLNGSGERQLKSDEEQLCSIGPIRLSESVRTDTVFRLIGSEFSCSLLCMTRSRFMTLENYKARQYQAKFLVNHMASLHRVNASETNPICVITYLLENTLDALRHSFPVEGLSELLQVIRSPDSLGKTDDLHLQTLVGCCSHPGLRSLLSPVLVPLLSHMRSVYQGNQPKENSAMAWVYIGLLRVHLLTPSSPLDPGRKPAAKVEQHNQHLMQLYEHLRLIRVDCGLKSGDFSSNSDRSRRLVRKIDNITGKLARQERKRVERISTAPPYYDLYRETKNFAKTLGSRETIESLTMAIRSAGESSRAFGTAASREGNWQNTTGAFTLRLSTFFEAYEDITVPLLVGISCLQRGVRELFNSYCGKPTSWDVVSVFDTFIHFPVGDVRQESIDCSRRIVSGDIKLHRNPESASIAVALASLSRFALQRSVLSYLDSDSLINIHALFVMLCRAWLGTLERLEPKDETDDEVFERTFREQFPNHSREFSDMFGSQDAGDDTAEQCRVASEESRALSAHLEDTHISLLTNLHREFFQTHASKYNDACRIREFHCAFGAASEIHQQSRDMGETESMSPHTMALSLTSSFRTSSTNLNSFFTVAPNFHRDPNPVESIKAAFPLQCLMTRTSQLLTAFPGHSVLLSVGEIAEKVSKLEITSTSVGKIMTGLEVILRKAQEWEQHASDRVKLGPALKEVSMLVAHWRKLELQSWSSLLDMREERFIKQAQMHWMRLYSIIHTSTNGNLDCFMIQGLPMQTHVVPCSIDFTPWLWKGLKRKVANSMLQGGEYDLNIDDLTKSVDTFMLTATLGQFSERLRMIKAFANQLDVQPTRSTNQAARQYIVARMLHSIHSYYGQFKSALETKQHDLRHPIEKKLKDEVKLAKWDEQTYYALADATERNHRKLMKFLREYDAVLDSPISSILEKHQCSGIRATDSLDVEPTTKIPPFKSMFPSSESPGNIMDKIPDTLAVNIDVIISNYCGLPATDYILRLDHYQRRLQRVISGQHDTAWARFGALGASELCTDIFERIESLRRLKTTKPMKARALVDLFKALKTNGFKNTKWSVPEQQRHMVYLFHLPPLNSGDSFNDDIRVTLVSGNDYFQKCIAEISRLRSEVSLLGSQFLSHREIQLMLHLSEHGLLMISQQKSVLSESLSGITELTKKLECLRNVKKSLPLCQPERLESCKSFNERIRCAAENIQQLRLLLTMSLSVVETAEKRAMVQDSIANVETMVVCLKSLFMNVRVEVIKQEDLDDIAKANISVASVLAEIFALRKSFREKCVLPTDIFDKCIDQLQLALIIAKSCSETPVKHDEPEVKLDTFLALASSTVEKTLLAIQAVCKVEGSKVEKIGDSDNDEESDDRKIWDCHSIACHQLDAFNIRGLSSSFEDVIHALQQIHSSDYVCKDHRDQVVSVTGDISIFLGNVMEFAKSRVTDYISFFRESTKLQYVLLRVFRTLVAKGYCSSDTSEEDCDGEDGGDVSGMNFEDDVEGTGMGEGDGKNDVTDQLESEEQLLGLKNDEQNESEDKQQESKQLNEEEAKQGMEMEADFEGELCDIPDDLQEDDKEGDDKEEELDREMGDGQDPNEDVVDEKMWGDSDDEDDINKSEEKFEKDSGVKGESLEDELRTKEDDEKVGKNEDDKEGDGDKEEANKEEAKPGTGDDMPPNDEDDDVNEDLEDNYEDQHRGVDVRDEAGDQEEEEPMELDDINLDGGDDAEDQEGGNPSDDPVVEGDDMGADDEEGQDDSGGVDKVDDPDGEEDEEEAADTGAIQSGANEDNENQMDEGDDEDQIEPELGQLDQSHRQESVQESFGIKSNDGADNVKEQPKEEESKDETNGQGDEDNAGDGDDDQSPQDPSGGSSGGNGQGGAQEEGKGNEAVDTTQSPNPFKNPGDASLFWHKKLKVLQKQDDGDRQDDSDEGEALNEDDGEADGQFEFTASNENSTTQVLGETTEEDAVHVDADVQEEEKDPGNADDAVESKEPKPTDEPLSQKQSPSRPTNNPKPNSDPIVDDEENDDLTEDPKRCDEQIDEEMQEVNDEPDDSRSGNQVVSDMSQLRVCEDENNDDHTPGKITTESATTSVTQEEALAASRKWSRIQGETHSHARRLCEKLRLVMEPLIATKLKGDYRTGKRINMKRVIGYIASGYRKDKIWLRRTKPAKRNYRVLLAVDNSESMLKSGAGEMALQAMATLALGMSQLEIGELGVASFGQDMRLLHPFHTPFTSESGSSLVRNFGFDESRTRTALCVESALEALQCQGAIDSMQLIFMISDGRIERDSRANLRRLMREMAEKNILLVMIIVEPGGNKKDSIIKMKEVKFEKGKPVVRQFMEDYPFPYYLVLEDMHQLPEVLGDALRQWFEMISQMQK